MIKYQGINHLAMVTGDMTKTVLFWRDLLGLRLVAALGKPGYRHYFFQISETDLIAFFEWTGAEPIPDKDHGRPVTGPFVFDHVALGVETEEDLWTVKDKLAAADFWVSEVIDHGFIHSVYAFDPNGIPIEFSCNVAGMDIRRHPNLADHGPPAVRLEGPEPRPDRWPPVKESTPLEERKIYPGAGSEFFHGKKEA